MADGAKSKAEAKTTEKNGSRVMLDVLAQNNVDMCWGYPGGAILPFYDELYSSKIKHFLMQTIHINGCVTTKMN